MKHRKLVGRLAGFCLAGLMLVLPLASRADPALAVEMGCYNCHGAPARGDAPSFERLAAKFEKRRGDSAAEQHVVDELLRGEPLHPIPAHERLSPETARLLVRWLSDGAK
jgi:cytochrome c551/c552